MRTCSLLVVLSAVIIFVLGVLHLVLTFRSTAFHPRDAELESEMKRVSPLISNETTMWKAGIGFHASHSIGAMLFGVVYTYLALEPNRLLFNSAFLLIVGVVYLVLLVILCRLYWVRLPSIGMLLATLAYVGGIIANLA